MQDSTIAKRGDWGTVAAKVAQRLINKNKEPHEADLIDDGKFGTKTYNAAKRFQERPGRTPPLMADGIVGPKTFAALGLRPLIEHPVRLRAQRQPASCWAAAAAMLRGGREPGPGPAQTNQDGSLVPTGDNVEAFGKSLGWDYLPGLANPDALYNKLLRAPLWMAGESLNALGSADMIHAVVLAGLYTYEWNNSTKGLYKIYDPLPVGRGRIYFMDSKEKLLPDGNSYYARWYLSPLIWNR